ncbi:MAG: hypothetical protein ABIV94_03275 [Acidimicrobiales bacterium]
MNRWARRHRALLEADLRDGERLLAALTVAVRGRVKHVSRASTGVPADPTGPRAQAIRGTGRDRRAARRSAAPLALPLPGRIFAIGITDRRVLLWRTSRWLARPAGLAFAVPVGGIAAITGVRRVGSARLVVQVDTAMLTLGALAPFASVRPLAAAFAAARGSAGT